MNLTFRRLQEQDVDAVADLAESGLRPQRHSLVYDRTRVMALIEHFRKSVRDFHLVAFDGGRPVAAIAVAVQPMLFFERFEAVVVMCFSAMPGAGVRLIREFMRWFEANPALRKIGWVQEDDADPRLIRILKKRWGFGFSQYATLVKA